MRPCTPSGTRLNHSLSGLGQNGQPAAELHRSHGNRTNVCIKFDLAPPVATEHSLSLHGYSHRGPGISFHAGVFFLELFFVITKLKMVPRT